MAAGRYILTINHSTEENAMRHTCPDGTQTRLIRDDVPVGVVARHTCPNCGWSRAGQTILRNAKAILTSASVRTSLR